MSCVSLISASCVINLSATLIPRLSNAILAKIKNGLLFTSELYLYYTLRMWQITGLSFQIIPVNFYYKGFNRTHTHAHTQHTQPHLARDAAWSLSVASLLSLAVKES